eukprot:COSAG02_NODE_3762_length_6271_cov_49.947181_6_plen_54_part_00
MKQAMPGQFKWESTPGRWLLNVIYEFFTEPNDSLATEKCKVRDLTIMTLLANQ